MMRLGLYDGKRPGRKPSQFFSNQGGGGIVDLGTNQASSGFDLDSFEAQLAADTAAQEAANKTEFDRKEGAIGDTRMALDAGLADLFAGIEQQTAGNNALTGDLSALMLEALGLPSRQEIFADRVNPVLGDAADRQRGFVEEAQRLAGASGDRARDAAEGAVSTSRQAVSELDRNFFATAQGAAAGLQARMQEYMNQANSNRNPDGSLKSARQREMERRSAEFEVGTQTALVTSELRQQYDFQRAALKNQVSQAQQQLANVELQIAELERGAEALGVQAESDIANRAIEAGRFEGQLAGFDLEQQSQVRNAVANLNSAMAQFNTTQTLAGLNYAADMALRGNAAIYEMIQSNPTTVVTKLAGMLALANAAQAQSTSGRGGQFARANPSQGGNKGLFNNGATSIINSLAATVGGFNPSGFPAGSSPGGQPQLSQQEINQILQGINAGIGAFF